MYEQQHHAWATEEHTDVEKYVVTTPVACVTVATDVGSHTNLEAMVIVTVTETMIVTVTETMIVTVTETMVVTVTETMIVTVTEIMIVTVTETMVVTVTGGIRTGIMVVTVIVMMTGVLVVMVLVLFVRVGLSYLCVVCCVF